MVGLMTYGELLKKVDVDWPALTIPTKFELELAELYLRAAQYYERSHFFNFHEAVTEASQRLEAVNRYFRVKGGEVFEDRDSLTLLCELQARKVIPRDEWENVNFSKNTIALAKLAAANFAEVSQHSVRITDSGEKFLKSLLE